MKKSTLIILGACFLMLFAPSMKAQETKEKDGLPNATQEEEDGPIMFKFEPDFISKNEKRKEEIALTRSIIDTLGVSERKRLKLLRDLYKNGVSKRLKKALLVDNTYEEDIDE